MNWLKKIIDSIASFFRSPKAKAALETAASLVTIAAPIVAQIAALTPNKTDDEVIAAYQKYGIPLTATIQGGEPTAIGNALLNLATTLLRDKLPEAQSALATNILQTAVQMAVTAVKAG